MGTLVKITLYAPDEDEARAAFAAAFARIRELDETLSDYKPDERAESHHDLGRRQTPCAAAAT